MKDDKSLEDIRLEDKRTTPDGEELITLEDYLSLVLRHPLNTQETLRLNCSSILKLLDVFPVGQSETKRAATWLRLNGYRAGQRGKMWKVALVHAHKCRYRVI
jgi:hypothetical protein